MFDISGTMLMVYWLLVYGLKSIWLPFLWPVFNQIFLMMFLSGWLRRSNVLTGAEWIQTRFGRGTGANLAHLSVVVFALIQVIGMLAYAFKGIGKFAVVILPWRFTGATEGLLSDENIYAIILLLLTSLYAIKGGMVSVVITEVMQFSILTVTSIIIGCIAIYKVSPEMVQAAVPAGWFSPFFGWKLGLDWTGILDKANDAIRQDGNEFFTIIFGLMFFKGVLASLAGPLPELRHAARAGHPQPARGLHDERVRQRRALLPPLHDDRRPDDPGPGLLHAADARHGQAGLREAPADRADAICPRRRGRPVAGRPAGRVHVEFRGHHQRRPRLPRQRHLQALHQPAFLRAHATSY